MRSQAAANIVIIWAPYIPFMIRKGQVMSKYPNGHGPAGRGRNQFQPVQKRCAVSRREPEMDDSIVIGSDCPKRPNIHRRRPGIRDDIEGRKQRFSIDADVEPAFVFASSVAFVCKPEDRFRPVESEFVLTRGNGHVIGKLSAPHRSKQSGVWRPSVEVLRSLLRYPAGEVSVWPPLSPKPIDIRCLCLAGENPDFRTRRHTCDGRHRYATSRR